MKRIFTAIILALFTISIADAAPAYPHPVKVTQPDGSVLTLRLHGDEYLNWVTCGNSLVAKGSDGYYHYAAFDSGGISRVQGSIVRSSLSGDGSAVKPPKAAVQAAKAKRQKAAADGRRQKSAAAVGGTGPYLVMLIEFSDLSFNAGDGTVSNTDFSNMLNQAGYSDNGGTGSVKDYYTDNSHNAFTPQFDVIGPVRVDGTMASYSAEDGMTEDGAPRLLKEACQKADDYVDFSKYDLNNDGWIDNVFFYFAGYNAAEGAEGTIWPHAWSVSYSYPVQFDGKYLGRYSCSSELKGTSGAEMAGIGTFCHEFGHTIDLPDFYDTDYEENGQGNGLDNLSLMSAGNYNNEGRTPPYLTYEERHILGWDNGLTLLEEGANTLSPISGNKAYYCPSGTEGEYYLFESRPMTGWDAYTYNGGGMAVYHVDKSAFVLPDGTTAVSKWNSGYEINIFADHQCMDLVETVVPESALRYYAEEVFPGYHNVTELNAGTTPALVAWTGQSTGYSLSDISFNAGDGSTSLTVSLERQISGTVSSLSGSPLAGVEITVTPVELQPLNISSGTGVGSLTSRAPVRKAGASEIKVITDGSGAFLIPITAGGDYIVSARKEGYLTYSSTVTVQSSMNIPILLKTINEGGDTVLKKYTGEPSGYGIGNDGLTGYDWYAGVRFSSDELTEYVGDDISSISFTAYNGGDGTVLEMGVKVFFNDEEVLSRRADIPVFGTTCTVDISDAGLTVPEGKSVLFAYYLYDSSYDYPLGYTDLYSHVDDACLMKIYNRGEWSSDEWDDFGYANMIISATVSNPATVITLAGFNMIAVNSEYTEGETIELRLAENPSNLPSSAGWYVDGESVTETQMTLPAGIHSIKAFLTYPSGRTEWVETSILVR